MNTADPRKSSGSSEAELISQRVIPYLQNLGYQYLNSNVRISIDNSVAFADLVVHQENSGPYIVAEVKQRLPDEVTLLDPTVQKVFSFSVILGPTVRYLLVTDGSRHYWFERSAGGQSLIRLAKAPHAVEATTRNLLFTEALIPVTDPEQFIGLML